MSLPPVHFVKSLPQDRHILLKKISIILKNVSLRLRLTASLQESGDNRGKIPCGCFLQKSY